MRVEVSDSTYSDSNQCEPARIPVRVRVGVSKREEVFVDENKNLSFENRTM